MYIASSEFDGVRGVYNHCSASQTLLGIVKKNLFGERWLDYMPMECIIHYVGNYVSDHLPFL